MSSILRFLLLLATISIFSCNSKEEKKSQKVMIEPSSEDFNSFYDRFHSDSLFQMSRIKFPLAGKYIDGFENTDWTKENWTMLKVKIFDVDTLQFKTIYKKTDTTFTEKTYIEDSGFSTEYKFELLNNKWFLVYANDVNL